MTPSPLDNDLLTALIMSLCGVYELEAAHGLLRILARPLRGDAVAVGLTLGDQLVLVVDWDKPNAAHHARALLREEGWRLFRGSVEPGRELPIPEHYDVVTRLALVDPSEQHPAKARRRSPFGPAPG